MPRPVARDIKCIVKKFVMPAAWLNPETFFGLPAIMGIANSITVRDPDLWFLSTFLNGTFDRNIEGLTGRGTFSTRIQIERARDLFATTVADPDPIPLSEFPFTPMQLKQRQSAIYSALMKGKYNTINCDSILEKIGKTSAQPQQTLTGLRQYAGKAKVAKQRLFDYLRFLCNGVYTKDKRSKYEDIPDKRCYICKKAGTTDSIQHYLGYQTEQCSQIKAASERLQVPFNSLDLTEDTAGNQKLILFTSAVFKAALDFRETSFPDQRGGAHIRAWYDIYTSCNAPKPKPPTLRYQREDRIFHGYHEVTGFFVPLERRTTSNNKTKYHFADWSISQEMILNYKNIIHIVLGAHSKKVQESLHGWYSYVVLGAQFLPIETRGSCPAEDADLHISLCYALQNALKFVERKRNIFAGKIIGIYTDNENLVKIVNNQRRKSRRQDYYPIEHETKQMFDRTRNEIHNLLEFGHNYKTRLPWVDIANKIAQNAIHGQRPRQPWIPLIPTSFATLHQAIPN